MFIDSQSVEAKVLLEMEKELPRGTRPIYLRGPDNPLEMCLSTRNRLGYRKNIKIDRESVNSGKASHVHTLKRTLLYT